MIHRTCCAPMHSTTQPQKETGDWIPAADNSGTKYRGSGCRGRMKFPFRVVGVSGRNGNAWLYYLRRVGMKTKDTLAERLRRRPAKPIGSPCVGSNPTGVVFQDCVFVADE